MIMDFRAATGKRTSPPPSELVDRNGDGSANLKRARSGLFEDAWRGLQVSGPAEFDFSSRKAAEPFAEFGGSSLWPSGLNDGQRMLSFSSSQSPTAVGVVGGGSSRNITFSVCRNERTAGGPGGVGVTDGMCGPFARAKWPFTPSQWMELEHQALIYKHIVANVPIPSNLLISLKSRLDSYRSPGSYVSNFLGWGPFHLGYSRSNDPEPGRCRRTDGKKWRCSREVVPDQRYCERHINRGRHRSRKPVEGQTGHAVAGSTTSKVAPIASTTSASVVSSSSAPNNLRAMQHQNIPFQPNAVGTSANVCDRSQGFQGLSLTCPTTDLKPKDATCSIQRQHTTFVESVDSEFGSSFPDFLPNTSQRIPYMNGSNSGSFLQLYANEANGCNSVPHFIDDWQKDHSVHAPGSWPEDLKSDWTQLSMSIPVARDFSSSFDSPAQDKSSISTLKLSNDFGEPFQKQSSWLPVTWGNSVSGPLGEVLTSTGTVGESYSSMKPWKSGPQMGSSPTGVLQKSTFISLPNSSYGSSPLGDENKKVTENASPCNDFPGSALASSASIPSP